MKRKVTYALLLSLLVAVSGFLYGCGKQAVTQGENQGTTTQETQEETSTQSAPEETPEPELTKLKIGASPVPHAEILKYVIPALEEKGIALDVIEFTDYIQPNLALQNKELDANYFQHVPYLEDFNTNNNTQLSAAISVHFEPLGIYPGKTKSLEELKDGDTVAVPNDTTNEARALLLLEEAGLIKLKEGADLTVTAKDIVENPKKLKIAELEAAQLSRSLQDVNIAVINGNYALEAGLNAAEDALRAEDKDSLAAKTFANVVAVRTGEENDELIQILKEVLTSEDVRKFLEEKYQGSVIPAF